MANEITRQMKKNTAGFTLIELVVAILVFALGIMGIMKMHQASIQSNTYSMQLTTAVNLAQDRIEFLRGLPLVHNSLTVGGHIPVTVTSMGVPYTIFHQVTVTPDTFNNARSVNVNIQWWEKNINHQLNMSMVMDQL